MNRLLLSENPAKFLSLSNRAAEKSRQTIKGQRNVRNHAHQLHMKAVRFLAKTKILIPLLSSHQRFVPFSSYPATAATNPRFRNSFFDESEGSSAVYKHALKFQRPTTIRWQDRLFNSASFIGTVVRPVEALNAAENGNLCAYTVLSVSLPHQSRGGFRILLKVQGEMAEMCFKHLKENDLVYVSGRLFTSTKADENGSLRLLYKVLVKELNYVTQRRDPISQKYEEPESAEGRAARLEKWRDRLHLWQVFFSNPYEWWDNRKQKLYPGSPDFKHKDTGEALWLSPNDPPWIKKQLQLLDLEMGLGEPVGCRACLSKWEYDA
ncbi:hypothetical protein L484_014448 [Morus notabilis]|uniref:Protein OSB1 n=1 Tax=Morus notabilis TaxID=981085 RepID=W9QJF5_9ROSA|nr:hypothetical protein L484_014448 [Morus notabilis]